uniref:type II toxin-antitoxin system Phd/YefM family antitoxin n=1 Tax=Ferribacterium limneticum TaxID=76259 RepID=UPI00384E0295
MDLYGILNRLDIMRVVNFSDAVVMSLDTFNSLMETVQLLKSPANAAHLVRSIEQYRKGKTEAQDLADA